MEISIEHLKANGFEDLSPDGNNYAYRKRIPGTTMEICWVKLENMWRLQTIGSGITIPLKGIHDIKQLSDLIYMITGINK